MEFSMQTLKRYGYGKLPEWLPIESAPKDGIDIWLYDRQWSPDPQIGYWCYHLGSWLSDSGSKLNPTRWQPLPEPPKPKGEG